jgi:transcription-repair coupling factor (superfamily II helicase)
VWEKQKAKVSEAVMDMAAELIEIQAARQAQNGVAYPPDTEWQKEFEAEFPYEPTEDQITSAEDIKQDMQKTRPMDRLLCGDVGYGKTELAMRAAFVRSSSASRSRSSSRRPCSPSNITQLQRADGNYRSM